MAFLLSVPFANYWMLSADIGIGLPKRVFEIAIIPRAFESVDIPDSAFQFFLFLNIFAIFVFSISLILIYRYFLGTLRCLSRSGKVSGLTIVFCSLAGVVMFSQVYINGPSPTSFADGDDPIIFMGMSIFLSPVLTVLTLMFLCPGDYERNLSQNSRFG